jgi:small subunit ribosomal protein S9
MAKVKEGPWTWGTGRRKSSSARVRIKSGGGAISVNKREFKEYFPTLREQQRVLAPLVAVGVDKSLDLSATVIGGGLMGQSAAISMGIARALLKYKPDCEPVLREGRFLTRDARQKERKKYGQRGARRSFQFSKR